jgi:putative membrane protein
MLDEIKAAPADQVDAVYMKNQRVAHNAALALHQGYAANGDTPALKTAASEIAPVVQTHLEHVTSMPTM